MEDQTFRNYLHDLGTLIKEHAREAKEQKDSSEGSSSQAYGSGYVMAWYEVVSLMQQQAEAFGIPFESLDLHDIDPDKDLFRSVTIQKEAHFRRESAQTGGINGLRGQAP